MHGTIQLSTEQKPKYWAACQILSHRGHFVRSEMEKTEHGTFLPTYVRVRYVAGKKYVQELPLLTGYLFFMTEGDKWGEVTDINGVCRVLANGTNASRVSDDEMHRLVLGHATGIHNKIESSPQQPRKRNPARRRRPRPGKRLRAEYANR